ncbi:hypothetical protein BDN72DRAFT_858999 [Pluteus cervinus]|uniref:Uncharacterized protein n=1 Tax=Pluteus cervinus TaxID=181527 RepID=A0ACD3APH1_9AGAR|nr:hypothetical protein BDN72DRAFT_858999 [Pluteus cervinus]
MAEGPPSVNFNVHDATRVLEAMVATNPPDLARLKRRSVGAPPMQGPPLPPPNYPPPPLPASAQSSNLGHNLHLATRRPARSSPLAGPSLDGDDSSVPESKADNSSFPASPPGALTSPGTGSVPMRSILHRERVKSAQGPQRPLAADIAAMSAKGHSPSKRVSFIAASPERKAAERRSEDLPRRPISQFLADPSIPVPLLSDKALRSAKSAQSLRSYQSSTAPPTVKANSFVNGLPAQRESSDSENWLTVNPYDVTPQFTRLALGAEGVVLPVPARKRKSSNNLQKSDSEKSLGRKSSSSSVKSVASTFVAAVTRRSSQSLLSPSTATTPQMTPISSASTSSVSLPTPTGPISNRTSCTSSSDSIAFLPAKMVDASTAELGTLSNNVADPHAQESSGTNEHSPLHLPHIFQKNNRLRATSMGALLGRSPPKPQAPPAGPPHAHTWGIGSFKRIRRPHTADTQSPVPSYMKTAIAGSTQKPTSKAPSASPGNLKINTNPIESPVHTPLRSSSKALSFLSFGSSPRDSSDSSREMVSHLPFALSINTTPSNLAHIDVAPDSPLLGKPSGSFIRTAADYGISPQLNGATVNANGGRLPHGEGAPVKIKKTGTVKRLWRTLTSAKKPPSLPQAANGTPASTS